jgi:hypothetical protein
MMEEHDGDCACCQQAARELEKYEALAERRGTERERRRIRRAQAKALTDLRSSFGNDDYLKELIRQLDAATRAPRAKRRRV